MGQRVVVGTRFSTHANGGGGLNGYAVGDQLYLSLTGSGSVLISLMFLVNGSKTYQNVTFTSDGHVIEFPDNTTYYEFNIQSISSDVSAISMEIWEWT